MLSDQLNERLRRIYAAIGETYTVDPVEFKQTTRHVGGDTFAIKLDFQGALTEEQIQNVIFSAVHNTANLRDHLKRWARQNGESTEVVDRMVEASEELKIVIDISNRDKHGGAPRDGGFSGRSPDLKNIRRALVLPAVKGDEEKPSFTVDLFGDQPPLTFHGGAHVQISADIVDESGQYIGNLTQHLEAGIVAWEDGMRSLGIRMDD